MIEAALNGVVASEPQVKISKAGNEWMSFGVAVGTGDKRQYVQLAVFGDCVIALKGKLSRGSKIYAEGTINVSEYFKDGEKKFALNMACTRVNQTHLIGRNKPPQPSGRTTDPVTRASDIERPFDDAIGF